MIEAERDFFSEKCGVIGVYTKNSDAAKLVYFGLWALQHRGQETSGISSTDGKKIYTHKDAGLVAHVYQENSFKKLKGNIAIGHNRYGTSGGSDPKHAQPSIGKYNLLSLGHNGNLPSVEKLKEFLKSKKISTIDTNDTEMMQKALEYLLSQGIPIETAIKKCFEYFTGAFCITMLTKNKLIAIRDSKGIRPLSVGKIKGGYAIASETCALDTIQAKHLRDVQPGEMIVIDRKGFHSYKLHNGEQKLDIFEFIYFARPDSILFGKSVQEVRENMGKQLASECKIKADVVIPVPDSAIPAAVGFSKTSGIPFENGLIKNRYIHRTFIQPGRGIREQQITLKLNPLPSVLKGRDVIVIDDSIVRGSTSKKIVSILKKAGAKKVHMLVTSPPIKFPDFYGIDTPSQKELIGASHTVEKVKEYIGADSLCYLSLHGLIAATGLSKDLFSFSAFDGNYPIDLREKQKEIKYNLRNTSMRIAVLISNGGTGTNLQAIIDAIKKKKIFGEIVVVVSDTKDAYGLIRAKKNSIPIHILKKSENLTTLLRKKYSVDYVVMAGWKKIIPESFIDAFPKRILNVHPGLIPDSLTGKIKNPDNTDALWNRGKYTNKAIDNFFQNKTTYAGSSVHFLSKEFDFGEVLGRTFEKIKPHDSVDSLYNRLKKKEHKILVESLARL